MKIMSANLPGGDRAEVLILVHERGRLDGREPKRFNRRNSGIYVDFQLAIEGVSA